VPLLPALGGMRAALHTPPPRTVAPAGVLEGDEHVFGIFMLFSGVHVFTTCSRTDGENVVCDLVDRLMYS